MEPEAFYLSPSGWVPNNPSLPALYFAGAVSPGAADLAAAFEELFATNGWPPQWRDGVYRFTHYHSTAHEVMGIAAGNARLRLGGESGRDLNVRAGDTLVLPAGTGHRNISASPDFLVVGAYPAGQMWDLCRGAPDGPALHRLQHLPFPATDPVQGPSGALTRLWVHALPAAAV